MIYAVDERNYHQNGSLLMDSWVFPFPFLSMKLGINKKMTLWKASDHLKRQRY